MWPVLKWRLMWPVKSTSWHLVGRDVAGGVEEPGLLPWHLGPYFGSRQVTLPLADLPLVGYGSPKRDQSRTGKGCTCPQWGKALTIAGKTFISTKLSGRLGTSGFPPSTSLSTLLALLLLFVLAMFLSCITCPKRLANCLPHIVPFLSTRTIAMSERGCWSYYVQFDYSTTHHDFRKIVPNLKHVVMWCSQMWREMNPQTI